MEDYIYEPLPGYSLSQPTYDADSISNKNSSLQEVSVDESTKLGCCFVEFGDTRKLIEALRMLSQIKEKVICKLDSKSVDFVYEVPGISQLKISLDSNLIDKLEFYEGLSEQSFFSFGVSIEHFFKGIDFNENTADFRQKTTSLLLPSRGDGFDRTLSKTDRTVFMTYFEAERLLTLTASGNAVTCKTVLSTYLCNPPSPNFFHRTDSMASITLKSFYLKEALVAIDPSCERVGIKISPVFPHLSVIAAGTIWEVETDLPLNDKISLDLKCQSPLKSHFRYSYLKNIVPALSSSDQVRVCLNDPGFLSLKFLLNETASYQVAEFVCAPSII